jgi:hypothetical protein
VKRKKSKIEKILDGTPGCASKNCDGQATFFMKLTIANTAGMFCVQCTNELKAKGLVEEVIQN